ncbi:hydrogenase large subunit [Candidatus Nitrosacidococcus tergens]|uniref:Putative [NiFe]-hydrogenase, large subunit HyfG n=1 Tax=Candidatus Nitrosacidococcus tergens TaxID=553981 RepID=A0A7G1QAC3_9GAMM|nr:NADH-quinone oxidoreductase subunit C [Candidatus Nitrosacidococcus tergens]CAB1276274.1 putative [NiFe]-hydrogenase, large subunit HyfG [Candidatus Nitrosacidococcus tergens]
MTVSDLCLPDSLGDLYGEIVAEHSPWPRIKVKHDVWMATIDRLNHGTLVLMGLWGEPQTIHLAVADTNNLSKILVLTFSCPEGHYPSVGCMHPPAIRLERAVTDLFGLIPVGLPDTRPWLDHGKWSKQTPIATQQSDAKQNEEEYVFLSVDGDNVHQVPVGPVHAGIIEPGHFRISADGDTIVRLEARLGYTHKGIESLLQGADLEQAARLAARCSGDSTVAYGLAFAHAVESALNWAPPVRAVWLRALMAELERLANHLGDIGAICNDGGFAIMLAHCSVLREQILRESFSSFGHRLMMDRIFPGGVVTDIDSASITRITALMASIRLRFQQLVELYDTTASLQDRTIGTGTLQAGFAQQFGAGGFIGRASGRYCDARRWPSYPPYNELEFEIPVLQSGDVNARIWVRIYEVEQSIHLIEQILAKLPEGSIRAESKNSTNRSGEGMAIIEGFRGDILAWVRIDAANRIERCHLRDPSWFQWPLLESAIDGNIVADFPICNKSFNCSYSGSDL